MRKTGCKSNPVGKRWKRATVFISLFLLLLNITYGGTLVVVGLTNITAGGGGGNSSWNESYANTLYYPLSSNPAGYLTAEVDPTFSTARIRGYGFNTTVNCPSGYYIESFTNTTATCVLDAGGSPTAVQIRGLGFNTTINCPTGTAITSFTNTTASCSDFVLSTRFDSLNSTTLNMIGILNTSAQNTNTTVGNLATNVTTIQSNLYTSKYNTSDFTATAIRGLGFNTTVSCPTGYTIESFTNTTASCIISSTAPTAVQIRGLGFNTTINCPAGSAITAFTNTTATCTDFVLSTRFDSLNSTLTAQIGILNTSAQNTNTTVGNLATNVTTIQSNLYTTKYNVSDFTATAVRGLGFNTTVSCPTGYTIESFTNTTASCIISSSAPTAVQIRGLGFNTTVDCPVGTAITSFTNTTATCTAVGGGSPTQAQIQGLGFNTTVNCGAGQYLRAFTNTTATCIDDNATMLISTNSTASFLSSVLGNLAVNVSTLGNWSADKASYVLGTRFDSLNSTLTAQINILNTSAQNTNTTVASLSLNATTTNNTVTSWLNQAVKTTSNVIHNDITAIGAMKLNDTNYTTGYLSITNVGNSSGGNVLYLSAKKNNVWFNITGNTEISGINTGDDTNITLNGKGIRTYGATCSAGQYIQAVDNTTVTCATDADSAPTAVQIRGLGFNTTINCPAGSAITAFTNTTATCTDFVLSTRFDSLNSTTLNMIGILNTSAQNTNTTVGNLATNITTIQSNLYTTKYNVSDFTATAVRGLGFNTTVTCAVGEAIQGFTNTTATCASLGGGSPPTTAQITGLGFNTTVDCPAGYYVNAFTNTTADCQLASGSGTVTSITAGKGLDGGTITTTGTITANATKIQSQQLSRTYKQICEFTGGTTLTSNQPCIGTAMSTGITATSAQFSMNHYGSLNISTATAGTASSGVAWSFTAGNNIFTLKNNSYFVATFYPSCNFISIPGNITHIRAGWSNSPASASNAITSALLFNITENVTGTACTYDFVLTARNGSGNVAYNAGGLYNQAGDNWYTVYIELTSNSNAYGYVINDAGTILSSQNITYNLPTATTGLMGGHVMAFTNSTRGANGGQGLALIDYMETGINGTLDRGMWS